MVGNRQTQNIFLNSKSLLNCKSFGRLNCVFLKNSWSYGPLKQFLFFQINKKTPPDLSNKKNFNALKYAGKCQKFQEFFSSFFFVKFKISSFLQKELYNHKIYRQGTLGSKQQICCRICDKNQYLLIFDNFWKNLWFSPKFSFFEARFWDFKILGNRQTQKIIFSSDRKVHGDKISYP